VSSFASLGFSEPLLAAVRAAGFESPTPIQARAIPHVLEGRDLLGCAQTGSGKTAAFTLPTVERLAATTPSGRRPVRALFLAPTRELAAQIEATVQLFARPFGLRSAVIFGGVKQGPQVSALRAGVDVLVATPGRLLDLADQGLLALGSVETVVLDEADRMLDMGFIQPIRRIVAMLPRQRQSLLFSATMPAPIVKLAAGMLRDPVRVDVEAPLGDEPQISHRLYTVQKADKARLLLHLLAERPAFRAIVFTRTKHGANRLAMVLQKAGQQAAAIHGNKSQAARRRALDGFVDGSIGLLVATDIAARGIDVDDVDLVVNFELPGEPETFVHRVGRTARAGRSGDAIAFCEPEETVLLLQIERELGERLPLVEDHPYHLPLDRSARPATPAQLQSRRAAERHGGRSGGRPASNAPRPAQPRQAATQQQSGDGTATAARRRRRPRRRPAGVGGPPRS
jgi:ATP-dependent RNA helicase RhlE